ncbi:MAG TPA: hypothetical protein VH115_02945 [Solirubrobacteraceae bacterium]|nr:hypothetical protein [Solirubrobacteraceae bacterium]
MGDGGTDLRKDIERLLRDASGSLSKLSTTVRREGERLQKELSAGAKPKAKKRATAKPKAKRAAAKAKRATKTTTAARAKKARAAKPRAAKSSSK